MSIRRLTLSASVSLVAFLALGAPAGAAPIVADEQYKWFYWAAPLLVLSAIGVIGALSAGYYVRVIRPRSRGRKVT